MIVPALKCVLPNAVKHPWQAAERWYWRSKRLPHQNLKEIQMFKDLLQRSGGEELRVFEWGAGTSTIFYAKFLRDQGRAFQWFAMDNSKYWSDQCRSDIDQIGLSDRVTINCCSFPAYWEYPGSSPGDPVVPYSAKNSAEVAEYVGKPEALGGRFDVIFIDGRYRRRCLLAAKQALSPNGVVILHDAEREHYWAGTEGFSNANLMLTGKAPGTATKTAVVFCTNETNVLIQQLKEKHPSVWKTLHQS